MGKTDLENESQRRKCDRGSRNQRLECQDILNLMAMPELIGSWELADCAHGQYKIGQQRPRTIQWCQSLALSLWVLKLRTILVSLASVLQLKSLALALKVKSLALVLALKAKSLALALALHHWSPCDCPWMQFFSVGNFCLFILYSFRYYLLKATSCKQCSVVLSVFTERFNDPATSGSHEWHAAWNASVIEVKCKCLCWCIHGVTLGDDVPGGA